MRILKGLTGRLAVLGILGLGGLASIINSGCESSKPTPKNFPVCSATYETIQSSKGDKSKYTRLPINSIDLNRDGRLDVQKTPSGNINQRISKSFNSGALVLEYEPNNRNFKAEILDGETFYTDEEFDKLYPLLNSLSTNTGKYILRDKVNLSGVDKTDEDGRLRLRTIRYEHPKLADFERREHYGKDGKLVIATIVNKSTGEYVYTARWNEEKGYEIILNRLPKFSPQEK